MKYCKNNTELFANNVGFQTCLVNLNDLILKEGCSETLPFFHTSESVIDMDMVERIVASAEKRPPNKSMDSSFIITTNSSTEIVFVEFRFNYVNLKNITPDALVGKKTYSSKIFIDKGHTNIHNDFYYVFNKGYVEQGKRRLRNLHPRIPSNFIGCSIEEVKNKFF